MTIENRFHELPTLISKAFRAEDYPRVKALAHEYRSLAADHPDDWNYGNALHQVPTWLGLVALAKDDVATAKAQLREAAQTPGSPQLNSFGPNMLLAKRLLERGEKDAVLTYLSDTRRFWQWPFRAFFLRKWRRQIERGVVPDFRGSLYYHLFTPADTRSK